MSACLAYEHNEKTQEARQMKFCTWSFHQNDVDFYQILGKILQPEVYLSFEDFYQILDEIRQPEVYLSFEDFYEILGEIHRPEVYLSSRSCGCEHYNYKMRPA
ncbi:hypothetical protein AVEN_231271-1 [Araneus ventricosus]|uniref:Uncharacterized protein n=1 Tax=Araneus ventricosus TaxID=182803 RepID=A0A4Y2CJ54_ARAVE|nr:hypothetical protein AVEN_231271-1 [Araneus ventricosus]